MLYTDWLRPRAGLYSQAYIRVKHLLCLIKQSNIATSFPLPTMPLEWHKTENWLERYEFYIQSAKLTDTKKATFLANCGQDAYELIKGLLLPRKLWR